jgi:hypothetical protein
VSTLYLPSISYYILAGNVLTQPLTALYGIVAGSLGRETTDFSRTARLHLVFTLSLPVIEETRTEVSGWSTIGDQTHHLVPVLYTRGDKARGKPPTVMNHSGAPSPNPSRREQSSEPAPPPVMHRIMTSLDEEVEGKAWILPELEP